MACSGLLLFIVDDVTVLSTVSKYVFHPSDAGISSGIGGCVQVQFPVLDTYLDI